MHKEKCIYYDNASQWAGGELAAPVIVLGDTGSVLDDAWALVKADKLPVWGSVLASSQSSGRGQTRRHWQSPKGNIYAALRLPNVAPFDNTAAAPALSALIIEALENIHCKVQLKWPNDLVANLKKFGGILLEEKQGVIIAGIGININEAPLNSFMREGAALEGGVLPLLKHDFQELTYYNNNIYSDEIPLSERLWLYLVRRMYFCYTTESPMLWSDNWKKIAERNLLWKGQSASLHDTDTVINGIVMGLGVGGELALLVDGNEQYFLSGSLNFCDYTRLGG